MKPTLILALLAAIVSSVATAAQSGVTPSTARDADPSVGRVVTEIDRRIWCIHQDRRGNLWFGSNGNGVYRYDGQRIIHFSEADGLSGLKVRDIVEDRAGNVFISTYAGVSKFDGQRFTALEVVEAPAGDAGWELDPNDVWLVFRPGEAGPCRYDGERLYRMKLSESPAENAFRGRHPDALFAPAGVYSIYEDRRGHLWFGTAAAGLCRFDGETLSWMYEERLTTTPSGGAFGIRSVYEDRAGDVWICNTRQRFEISREVVVENGFNLIQYEQKEGLPDARTDTDANFTYFPSMTEDDAGALWMACGTAGVWKYDGEDVSHYAIADGAYALSVYCDRDGRLWSGTLEHGVLTFDGDRFVPFEARER